MRERGRAVVVLGVLAVGAFAPGTHREAAAEAKRPASGSRSPERPAPAGTAGARGLLDALPVRFEPNRGQADPAARFLARCRGFTCYLAESEAVFALGGSDGPELPPARVGNAPLAPRPRPEGTVRMRFEGAAPARYEGRATLPGVTNYLLGSDPARWRTGIPGFARAEAREVWPGVDLVFRGEAGRLEYDFVVAPGADPSAIRLRFEGAEEVRLDADGDLVLETARGAMRHSRPVLWQEFDGVRRPVDGAFALRGEGRVGLEVGAHDPSRPLVVDPKIEYASYHGGSGQDIAFEVVADSSGNVFVAGWTNSTDFPLSNPYQSTYAGGSGNFPDDAVVTKIASSGSLVYSTYLGGSGFDDCYGLAVDGNGSAHLAGITNSTNFPTASAYQGSNAGGFSDAYLAKLSSSGSSLLFSTYLGGSGYDDTNGVAVDANGSVFVVGSTSSTTFPTANPLQGSKGGGNSEGFVAKVASTGSSLLWSTYLGGNGIDVPWDVVADGNGDAVVVGYTDSTNFPTASPIQSSYAGGSGSIPNDAFITKINASGTALVFSTYFGGSGFDDCYSVTVDGNGAVAVTGITSSTNFPTTNAVQSGFGGGASDGYVVKLAASGTSVAYATYFGGLSTDAVMDCAQDGSGRVTAGGFTSSTDFPVHNAIQSTYTGGGSPYPNDGCLLRLGTLGEVLFSTYLGGSGFDDGYSVSADASGRAYLAGITSSTDYPTRNPGQASLRGTYDGYVTRVGLVVPAAPSNLAATAVGTSVVLLDWSDNSAEETGYHLQRKTPTSAWIDLAQLPAGTERYEDYSVGASTAYTYRVRATGADGASEWSNEATATTGAYVPIPTAPSNLSATPLTPTSVLLAWSDNSDNEVTFEVARRAPAGSYATVASLPAGTTGWTDGTVLPARDYLYRVRAVGTSGASPYAPEAAAATASTIGVTLLKGALTDSAKTGKDSAKAAGTFALATGTLDPPAGGLTLLLGTAASPVVLSAPAGDEGWKVRGSKVSWKSPKYSPTKAKFSFDLEKGTFKVSAKGLSLTATPANPLRVALYSGAEGGLTEGDWTVKKEGVFRFP